MNSYVQSYRKKSLIQCLPERFEEGRKDPTNLQDIVVKKSKIAVTIFKNIVGIVRYHTKYTFREKIEESVVPRLTGTIFFRISELEIIS